MSCISGIAAPGIWPVIEVIWAGSPARPARPEPVMPPMTARMTTVSAIHMKNWVRATRATPLIFPKRSSVALTEDTRTSTTLLDFSSMTLDMTIPQNIEMNI